MNKSAVLFLCMVLTAVSLYGRESAESRLAAAPRSIIFEGKDAAVLGPTRYPFFYKYSGNNKTCGEYFKRKWSDSGEKPGEAAKNGLSLAPLWLKSAYGNGKAFLPKADYTSLPGLSGRVDIPEAYRKSANVLFTWAVRIEGEKTAALPARPQLCTSWWGTTWQKYPAGEVNTALYVNGKRKGQLSVMTMPEAAGVSVSTQTPPPDPPDPPIIGDPTQTGSYVLTAEEFGGTFPASIDVDIRWYNDTSMRITSPAGMRNLIVTIIPQR